MPKQVPKGYEMPSNLSKKGKLAWRTVMAVLIKHDMASSGGSQVFYSPTQWSDRGEAYGCESELIVTYDGGDHGFFFSMDRDMDCSYKHTELMRAELEKIGMYAEEATCWYGSIQGM